MGYHRNLFVREFWKYVDIDPAERTRATGCGREAARRAGARGLARRCRRWPGRQPQRPPSSGAQPQGPALRLPDRRDRLRPGADRRPLLAHRHRRTSSRRCTATTTWRGRPRSCRCTRGGMPEVSGRLPRLDDPPPARHLLRRRPGLQGPAARAGGRRTTSTRSSASPTRRTRARCGRASRQWKILGLAELREQALDDRSSRSTTTHRSTACARSTATRCSSRLSKPRPRFLDILAAQRPARRAWRARWSSTTATRSPSTRWAPGRSG